MESSLYSWRCILSLFIMDVLLNILLSFFCGINGQILIDFDLYSPCVFLNIMNISASWFFYKLSPEKRLKLYIMMQVHVIKNLFGIQTSPPVNISYDFLVISKAPWFLLLRFSPLFRTFNENLSKILLFENAFPICIKRDSKIYTGDCWKHFTHDANIKLFSYQYIWCAEYVKSN